MKYIVNEKVVLSGPPEGPLAAYIGSFTDWVNEQGFASSSLWHRVHLAACFSAWLGNQGIRLGNISSDHPAQYLRYRARRVRPQGADRAALKHLIEFLCGQGVIPPQKALPARELIPVERCAQAFEQYLRDERALATATIIYYVPFIRSFLKDRFGSGTVKLSRTCRRCGRIRSTGLRLGEACNLELQDVDLKAAVLTIRRTKFGKTRLVPLHASTCQMLRNYIARRRRHWAQRPVSSYLFVSSSGHRLDVGNIHRTFYVLSRILSERPFSVTCNRSGRASAGGKSF